MERAYDVAVLGGGLAGLTVAIQLKRMRPETSIVVFEKKKHPLPEAAHKVGESTLEIGAHYFQRVCGMVDHLKEQQLPKMGLRFFLSEGDKADIATRTEMGLAQFASAPAYQLDRGRFENALGIEAARIGVEFVDDCSVNGVDLNGGDHTVTVRHDSQERSVQARWVIDASGRMAILKRKLGLAKTVSHHANAAWFRIARQIKIDDWSDVPEWREHVPGETRWLSTNHLLGPGYWFWLIPLGSGSTSFGLVADPDLVPFDEMRRFEPLMDWLHRNEPQAAAILEEHRDALQDFRILKHFAHGCKQVYSKDRWMITGEAGVFLDPLYSPGSDAIANSNMIVANLVAASLDGADVDEAIEFYDKFYLLLCNQLFPIWDHQYPILGDPEAAAAKVSWDILGYFSGLALLVVIDHHLADPQFMATVLPSLHRIAELNVNMQRYFQDWVKLGTDGREIGYLGLTEECYTRLNVDVAEPRWDPEWIRAALARNTVNLEAAAIEIIARTAPAFGVEADPDRLDPYTFSLRGEGPPPADYEKLPGIPDRLEPLRAPDAVAGITWATSEDPDAAAGSAFSVWPRKASAVPA